MAAANGGRCTCFRGKELGRELANLVAENERLNRELSTWMQRAMAAEGRLAKQAAPGAETRGREVGRR